MLSYAYMSGMRLSELVASKDERLRHEQLDDGEWAWLIMVLGKRNKWREVPLPDPAVEALQEHFTDRGLAPDLLANPPETPIIAKLSLTAPLSAARLYEALANAFERCATDAVVDR